MGIFLLAAHTLSGCEGCGSFTGDTPRWQQFLQHETHSSLGASVIELSNNDLLVAGWGYNHVSDSTNFGDILLMRCDADGNKRWSAAIGSRGVAEYARRVLETADGFLIFAQSGDYFDDAADYYLVKTDNVGRVQWEKRFGSPRSDIAIDVVAVDGGFVLLGTARSEESGDRDLQLIRVDEVGDVVWSMTYGTLDNDWAADLEATSDGGFAILAVREKTGNTPEYYVTKVDGDGDEQWSETYMGNVFDFAGVLRQTSDGGYVLTGSVGENIYLAKINSNGAPIWERLLASEDFNSITGIALSGDGGFVMVGTLFYGPFCDFTQVIKTDRLGNKLWSRVYGESGGALRVLPDITPTRDGDYVITGTALSPSPEYADSIYLAKVGDDGN